MVDQTTHDVMVAQTAKAQELLDYFQGQKGTWDDDVVEAQNAYGALANNLRNVVRDQLNFDGTVDPDEPNPTLIEGGTFNTIKQMVNAAPNASYIQCRLAAGKVHIIDEDIQTLGSVLRLSTTGAGTPAVIKPLSYLSAADTNFFYRIQQTSGSVYFSGVDIDLSASKFDAAFDWNALGHSLVTNAHGNTLIVSMQTCNVTGIETAAVVSGSSSGISIFGGRSVDADGDVALIRDFGVSLISTSSITLTNGAVETTGEGTLGQTILNS